MAASTIAETWRPLEANSVRRGTKLLSASLLAGALFLVIDLTPRALAAPALYVFVVFLCAGEVSARHLRQIGGACAVLAATASLVKPGATDPEAAVSLIVALVLIGAFTVRAARDTEVASIAHHGEAHVRSVFDKVGAVLWVEDYSGVRSALGALRDLGVQDLETYLREDPRFVDRMAARIRPVDINARGLEMLDAGSREAFFARHSSILVSVGEAFRSVLLAYWRGAQDHQTRARLVGLRGRAVEAVVTVTFPREGSANDHVVVSFTDVSALIEAQAVLEEAHRQAARAAHLTTLDALRRAITRQVAQPLSAILKDAENGVRHLERAPPRLAEASESFNAIVGRALQACERLSALGGVASGRAREEAPLDLASLVADTIVLAAGDLRRLGVELEHAPCVSRAFVLADRLELQQVLIQLLVNAAQAMQSQDQRAPITVLVEACEARSILKVIDRGPGLGSLCAPILFEPFFSTRTEALGMGLCVARDLAQMNGGDVRVEATPGGGATFVVDLPRVILS